MLEITARDVTIKGRNKLLLRDDVLILPWWRQMVAAAACLPCELRVVAPDISLRVDAPPIEEAREVVASVFAAWRANLEAGRPWPADSGAVEQAWGTTSQQATALDRLADRDRAWRQLWGTARDWSWADGSTIEPTIGQWQEATETVYGPYLRWKQQHLSHLEQEPPRS